MARRTEDPSENIAFQLKADIQKCTGFYLQLDESVDVADHAQLLVFIRITFDDFFTKESLLANLTLSQIRRGVDIYDALKDLIAEENNKFGTNTRNRARPRTYSKLWSV